MSILRFTTLALCLALGLGAAELQAAVSRENVLKAVFLFNFAQFVEWPQEAFAEADSPFVLCVLGADPFGDSLDEVVAGESIRNHRMATRRYREVEQASTCHILYVSAAESPRLEHILATLDGALSSPSARRISSPSSHGIIQFLIVENRLRLRINVEAAKAAKLSISAQLLRQAEIVGER